MSHTEVKTTLKVSIKFKFGYLNDNNCELKSKLEIIFVRDAAKIKFVQLNFTKLKVDT